MSTIKSSDEHLTLNADGTLKDIKFQANGVEKASISSAGAFTSTTIDATKLTGNLPAINGSALTNLPADSTKLPLAGGTMTGNVTHSSGYLDMGANHIYLADNAQVKLGTSEDLQIYHDGSHSYVSDTGTGNLNLKGQNLNLLASNSNDYLRCVQGGAVELYHNNVKKFETTAAGATVTGTLGVTTVDLGNWTITESGGVLFFATGGTNKMKLDASGNLTCVGDVTANGIM